MANLPIQSKPRALKYKARHVPHNLFGVIILSLGAFLFPYTSDFTRYFGKLVKLIQVIMKETYCKNKVAYELECSPKEEFIQSTTIRSALSALHRLLNQIDLQTNCFSRVVRNKLALQCNDFMLLLFSFSCC